MHPPGGNSGGSAHQVVGPRLPPNDSNCSGVVQHAMVLGSGLSLFQGWRTF